MVTDIVLLTKEKPEGLASLLTRPELLLSINPDCDIEDLIQLVHHDHFKSRLSRYGDYTEYGKWKVCPLSSIRIDIASMDYELLQKAPFMSQMMNGLSSRDKGVLSKIGAMIFTGEMRNLVRAGYSTVMTLNLRGPPLAFEEDFSRLDRAFFDLFKTNICPFTKAYEFIAGLREMDPRNEPQYQYFERIMGVILKSRIQYFMFRREGSREYRLSYSSMTLRNITEELKKAFQTK